MNFSYWEIKSWLSDTDFTIIGSGIVGLNCALHLRNRFPKAKILVLEKGILPQGASTKNAGFACFGSLSEIIDDLQHHSEAEVLQLIKKRIDGLQLLRETLGDKRIGYKNSGGYELFLKSDTKLYEQCIERQSEINTLLFPIFNANIFTLKDNEFGFNNIKSNYIFNPFEGELDTGKMMQRLTNIVLKNNIKILNATCVDAFSEDANAVKIKTNHFELSTKHLLIATNGFASKLIEQPVTPARAQVLVTKPIKDLHIKGTFHLDRGYYYFRTIDNRILLGGGRHLDFKTEGTIEFGQTSLVQEQLEKLLKEIILPQQEFEIEHRWSGIMGIGQQKKAIVKPIGKRIFCGIRLGGMGVAIGSKIGKDLADLIQ